MKILLADNRTARLGYDDEAALKDILVELIDGPGLAGTGYDADDLDEIIHQLGDGEAGHPYGREKITCPECGHQFVKDTT